MLSSTRKNGKREAHIISLFRNVCAPRLWVLQCNCVGYHRKKTPFYKHDSFLRKPNMDFNFYFACLFRVLYQVIFSCFREAVIMHPSIQGRWTCIKRGFCLFASVLLLLLLVPVRRPQIKMIITKTTTAKRTFSEERSALVEAKE